MNAFDELVDQQRPVRILRAMLRYGTLPHALLLTGQPGVGKQAAAIALAMACNCETVAYRRSGNDALRLSRTSTETRELEPCGACRACRKIRSGNHPDLLKLEPTGRNIRIAKVRELCETLAMRPFEANTRVVIITDAHRLNLSAGNALLKILEEPPDRTMFVLTAPQTADLLPTVVSRCQHIRFNPVRRSTIAAALIERRGLDCEAARTTAAAAEGSLTRANDMAESDWFALRDRLLQASGLDNPERLKALPHSALLAFAEQLAATKSHAPEGLAIFTTWLRDLVVYRFDPQRTIHSDCHEALAAAAPCTPLPILLDLFTIVRSAQRSLEANANLRLSLEVMMFRLARAVKGQAVST